MSLSAGAKIGPYEIVGLLGAGGMGEVYRGRDARLGRDVALKVLPAIFAAIRALVMELVEGPTLEERIRSGPMPIDEALSIAKQIAEALEAAHEKGIIHRDLTAR